MTIIMPIITVLSVLVNIYIYIVKCTMNKIHTNPLQIELCHVFCRVGVG